jgi:cytidine deaminase
VPDPSTDSLVEITAEDGKLVTLARGARLRAHAPRAGAAEGAVVRDTDGRTYAAATVENADPTLTTSALRGAVVAAASSGAREFEAAAVVTEGLPSEADLAVLREFGVGVPVMLAGSDGRVRDTLTT